MLLNDIRCVLDGITRLLIRAGLLEVMRCQNIPKIMRSVREQSFYGAAAGIGVVDAIALDHGAPGFIEFGGILCRVQAGCLHRLDEQGAGILCRTKQHTSVAIDI